MKKIIFAFVYIFAIYSCNLELEEEISWQLDEYPNMLVVESIITNETKQQAVLLTVTSDYFDKGKPIGVKNAEVTVSDGNNVYNFTESDTIEGLYLSDNMFACIPLQTYQLSITLDKPINGSTEYSAESYMHEGIAIDSLSCELYELPEIDMRDKDSSTVRDTTILAIYYFGQEPEYVGNYYLSKTFLNNKPLQNGPKEYYIQNDKYQNGNYTHINAHIVNVSDGDTVMFRLFSIERSFYNYIDAIQLIDNTGSSFSMCGPPANATGNISGGKALGFFAASYVSEKTGIVADRR
ncbi:MAG: DUF4249 domain-containing protein [Bacteroidales bacterium]